MYGTPSPLIDSCALSKSMLAHPKLGSTNKISRENNKIWCIFFLFLTDQILTDSIGIFQYY